MTEFIRLSRACIGDEEKQAVLHVMSDGYLGMGKEVQLFEQELEAFFLKKTKVVCVNTGTSALHLALQACGVGRGDEVLVPSITYVASFQAIAATGAQPIACDIDMNNGSISLSDLERKITMRSKAIMHVHYASHVGDRSGIYQIANTYGLRVVEDAAHSFGGLNEVGQIIGSEGDVLCFSFDGIKNITCGEGGAIVSSDSEIIEKARDLRLLGVKKDTDNRYNGKRSWDFEVSDQGWRYHMSNINAAIGREQLKKIEHFTHKRRNLVNFYIECLSDVPVKILDLNYNNICPHILPVLVNRGQRDQLRKYLLDLNIETGIHYKPNHLLSRFRSDGCTQAERFGMMALSLPLHCYLTYDDIARITESMKTFFSIRKS